MPHHLERDLTRLKEEILRLGAMVERALDDAIRALIDRDEDLARQVVEGDHLIDEREVEIEEECLKILALHQPVAIDLRILITALKVNNDLERVGDLAQNIARRSTFLARHPPLNLPLDIEGMSHKARAMVRASLDSLVNLDADKARAVCVSDDEIDHSLKESYKHLQAYMMNHAEAIPRALNHLSVARHLERIADHATNIAEDVIFLLEGKVVRHRELS